MQKRKRDPIDDLWKLFEGWVEDYCRINRLDKYAVMTAIAEKHAQLSKKLREKSSVELF